MVKFFSQTHRYEDAWSTVALAFFLRYPNRYSSHVISTDVLRRTVTPQGTLQTTRLILKRGALPAWFPSYLMTRSESWIVEESEVDPHGRVLLCETRNLDHRSVMEVVERTELREADDGSTIHKTEARFVSGVGWGLKKRIEEYSASRFKANIEKSRLGLALVVRLLREARMQALPFNRITPDGSVNNSDNNLASGGSSETSTAGKRWSYSDIQAAAIASSSSFTPSIPSDNEYPSGSTSASMSREQSRRGSPFPNSDTEALARARGSSDGAGAAGRKDEGWSSWIW
ncbi:hypothetical protein M408DRAFT_327782 [Serendipita vermifera MAFF 305830]|uniref:PRELI/MSF1 domain-containing protein n=1 Tax=Serendipita vermifera MAFF 305830 TaxID=933852 RepID=A0A0C2WXF5_SERVB|nr:hypothetical protein M408DRAFT_327782 [Serendipita vermifera MAFF 305830]